MADAVRISELPSLAEVRDGDITVVVDEAITQTSKVTVSQIRDHAPKVNSVSDEHVINGHLTSAKLGMAARNRFPVALNNAPAIPDNTAGENATRYQASDATITDFGLLWLQFADAVAAGEYLGATFSTPTGVIAYFPVSTPPGGWLECDGSSLLTTDYADLYALLGTNYGGSGNTFNLPDLRGEFIRGWDSGRGVDSGRTLGSAQVEMLQSHQHSMPIQFNQTNNSDIYRTIGPEYGNGRGWNGTSFRVNGGGSTITSPQTSGLLTSEPDNIGIVTDYAKRIQASGSAIYGTENRPRNVSLMACIRY